MSRACALLVACACPHLVYVCIVFINTSYEEKIPKHGHGEVPVAAAIRLLARGGPCGRCCCAGWADGCLAFRRQLGRRPRPNPTPNQATPAATCKCSLTIAQGRALAGHLGACRCRWRPGPGRNSSEACAEVGAVCFVSQVRVNQLGGPRGCNGEGRETR